MNYWFTADTHFHHKRIVDYCNRPFPNIEKMDAELIARWNARVQDGDVVYHLGDFAFGTMRDIQELLFKLNGNIIFIPGNHDSCLLQYMHHEYSNIVLPQILTVKISRYTICMCHYPMREWNNYYAGAWHLYGHSHGTLKVSKALSCDVGVDCWDYAPVGLDELEDFMKNHSNCLTPE